MPKAAYSTTIYISGTSTSMTAEACDNIDGGAGFVYRVTDSSKRVIDPNQSVTVYINGSPTASYTLKYEHGEITFPTDQSGNTITITAYYLPVLSVGTAHKFSLSISAAAIDTTPFKSTQHRTYIGGLRGASGSIGLLEWGNIDHDTGGGTKVFNTLMDALTPVFLRVTLQDSGGVWAGWVLLNKRSVAASLEGRVEADIGFVASSIVSVSSYGFGYNSAA